MSDFTSKIKDAVGKATSAAKEMAQGTTDMKDKQEQNTSQDDNAPHNMERGQTADEGQYAHVSEFDMPPMSQDNQLSGSMEQERMGSAAKEDMYDDNGQAEMDSNMRGQMYDNPAHAQTGSSTKDTTYDGQAQTEMGQSTLPASQYMPESGSAAKQS